MKTIYLFFLLINVNAGAQIGFYHTLIRTGRSAPVYVISNYKNPKWTDQDTGYAAFGVIENTSIPPEAQTRFTYFTRIGTGHTTDGNAYARDYYPQVDKWGPWRVVDSEKVNADSNDCRDTWGGRLRDIGNTPGNDSILLFICRVTGPTKNDSKNYFLRGNLDGTHWDSIPITYTIPRLQFLAFYGHMARGDSAGTYYMAAFEYNVDTGNTNHKRIVVFRTTDWFRHYNERVVFDQTGAGNFLSECPMVNLGGGKLLLFARLEQATVFRTIESSDYGDTWINQGDSYPLYSYNAGAGCIVPFVWKDSTANKFIALFNNRDHDWVCISRDNTVAANFGHYPTNYNNSEMYFYNQSENHLTANSSLGYTSMINIAGDSVFLLCWTHETNAHRANIMFSRDNFQTRHSAPDAPPSFAPSSIGSTGFYLAVTGYTTAQLNNISYFMYDVSTSPTFSSFVTCYNRLPGWSPTAVMHDVYWNGLWNNFNGMTASTAYYVRMKACNNAGCSAYTSVTVTTTTLARKTAPVKKKKKLNNLKIFLND